MPAAKVPALDLSQLPPSPITWPPYLPGVSLRFRRVDPDSLAVPTYDARRQITPPLDLDSKTFATLIKEEHATVVAEKRKATGRGLADSQGLRWVLEHLPREVGMTFDAHGFRKGVDGLVPLLEKGVDPARSFYSMTLCTQTEASGAFGAQAPFTKDGIFVVSGCKSGSIQTSGIKYVILGEELVNAVDMLQARFPSIKILPWHAAPAALTEEFNTKFAKQIPVTPYQGALYFSRPDPTDI